MKLTEQLDTTTDLSVLDVPWVVAPDRQRPVEIVPVKARKKDFTSGEAAGIMLALSVLEAVIGAIIFIAAGKDVLMAFLVVALIANCIFMLRMPVEENTVAPPCTASRITFTGRPD